MYKHFKHPLARAATVARLRGRDGTEQDCLIIVTTLEIIPEAKGYSAKNVARLNEAAKEFLDENEGIATYTVVKRPKEW